MRVFLIRLTALLIILWAGFQPGAALNPNGAQPAATNPSPLLPSAARPNPQSLLPATPTLTPIPEATLTPEGPSPTPGPEFIRFAVIGDYGLAGPGAERVANMIKNWGADFIITTGDNNYPDGTERTIDENIGQYYQAFIYPYLGDYGEGANTNRFFPVLGNHDWSFRGADPYLDYFTLPGNERYYDFIWGPVHFFALDSDPREPDGIGPSSRQADWLRERLAASSSPWKIVYLHRPPYSSSDNHGSTPAMQWPFEEWGASAVLAGHDHTYERILLDGFPYFVNGIGGSARYNFGPALPGSEARYNRSFGAMLVEANSQSITFEFYAATGKEPSLIDSFTLGE